VRFAVVFVTCPHRISSVFAPSASPVADFVSVIDVESADAYSRHSNSPTVAEERIRHSIRTHVPAVTAVAPVSVAIVAPDAW
jgi:hypothetical protein